MELNGKKLLFLGDSITQGHGVSSPEHIFWNVIARRTGAHCLGYGIGGTRIAPQRVPSADPRHDLYFGSRVEQMDPDADAVIVFGGTNDFGHGDAPLGTFADRTEDTFYGALHTLLTRLIEKYPTSQLVVMTPLHRVIEDDCGLNNNGIRRAARLETYVNAIIETAAFYAIPVLDLHRVSGIQPRVPTLMEHYMPDGLHPNDAGHLRIADKLQGFLQTL